ncbi:MAG: UDP-glucose--hexose-1-phosphate uridylyltransferase [Eubacteriales bacterium]|nr:UDP-glucose--hexose-1-phosphate uridylyltransferase [Eubacteriales bacterium]
MKANMPYGAVLALADYGEGCGLLQKADRRYAVNSLLDTLHVSDLPEDAAPMPWDSLQDILKALIDYAVKQNVIPDTAASRDCFDTRLMGCITPRPSAVQERFWALYQNHPKAATDYFYTLSQDCDYIRRYRIQKDVKWPADTAYGTLEITINLSKPEKDPKDIAAARNAQKSGYPACLLCPENEGYAGHSTHPARQTLRIIPLTIAGEAWGFQYSPYVYYNEHCIVLNQKHIPMVIDDRVFSKLFDFVRQFPHYCVGSNADLPIVGGSILSHEHFQGGAHEFPMAKAPVELPFTFPGFEDVQAGIVKWPMSVLRISGTDTGRLCALAGKILAAWRGYTDESACIYAETDGVPHNTITPIARMRNGVYELDLVLRNNLTTPEHPDGLYHPHRELHNIKKENIGLIEVMGLAVLPARLKTEMELVKQALISGADMRADERIAKHADWADGFRERYSVFSEENTEAILQQEIGQTFCKVLEHAGVYARTDSGREAFLRFLRQAL